MKPSAKARVLGKILPATKPNRFSLVRAGRIARQHISPLVLVRQFVAAVGNHAIAKHIIQKRPVRPKWQKNLLERLAQRKIPGIVRRKGKKSMNEFRQTIVLEEFQRVVKKEGNSIFLKTK